MADNEKLGSTSPEVLLKNVVILDKLVSDKENESLPDRFGVLRKSWHGIEQDFNRQITDHETRFVDSQAGHESVFEATQADKENRFQLFLLSSGYVFLGDYEDGPFQFSARNQYIRYDNQYYRLNAATDVGFTTTGTDAASFTNDVTHFVLMDGDTLRQNLGSSEGFGLIGQATYSQIRNFTGSGNSIMCCGAETRLDGAQGIFDQVPGGAVMTIPDDDCVHIRDPLGRLWKRRFEGNEIRMAWARAKSLKQTSAPQDFAFKNCLQAAASISESGYPQSIIKGLDVGVLYIAERHHIRCGNWPEYMAWKLPKDGSGNRFGIDMLCAIDMGAGFFVVQANNPYFGIRVDNTGIDFNVDNFTDDEIAAMVNDNYILRLEAMVNAPDFD